jgi:hypothetical protein
VARDAQRLDVMTVVLPRTRKGRRHLRRGAYLVQVTPGVTSSRTVRIR